MRSRFAIAPAIALGALVGLHSPLTAACPRLPDGLRASARSVNLSSPIPANGALVFELRCWHDCTPCLAAEQAMRVDLRDASGRLVLGGKPEQVFLSGDPFGHLVIWRPLEPLSVGARYTVQVSVVGQSDSPMSDVEVTSAATFTPLEHLFAARSLTYSEERGTIFGCDATVNDCDVRFLSFGDQSALLPALAVRVDAAASGQILYRYRDTTLGPGASWEPWSSGGGEVLALHPIRPQLLGFSTQALVD